MVESTIDAFTVKSNPLPKEKPASLRAAEKKERPAFYADRSVSRIFIKLPAASAVSTPTMKATAAMEATS
jgi:hypothetical protein